MAIKLNVDNPQISLNLSTFVEDELLRLIGEDFKNNILFKEFRFQFLTGYTQILTDASFETSISSRVLNRAFEQAYKQRNKKINYNKIYKKHQNVAKTDPKKAFRQLDRFMKNEANAYATTGGHTAISQMVKEKNVKAVKQWEHGMYIVPAEPRLSHLEANGKTVKYDEEFIINGHSTQLPREFGIKSEDINCGCGVTYIINP